jgi:hypothetical protein
MPLVRALALPTICTEMERAFFAADMGCSISSTTAASTTSLESNCPFAGHSDYYGSNGYCITFTGQLPSVTPNPVDGGYNCNGYTGPSTVTTPLPARGIVGFNPNSPPTGLSMIAVNQQNADSQVQEWNLQLEHQFGSKDVLNIAYVGTRGRDLSSYYPYNNPAFGTGIVPFPTLGNLNYNDYDGISNYDGLQLHAEHRAANGLTGTFSYAWGTRSTIRRAPSRARPRRFIPIPWGATATPARTSVRSSVPPSSISCPSAAASSLEATSPVPWIGL